MNGKYIAWLERTTGGRHSFATGVNIENCISEANKQLPQMNWDYIGKINATYHVVITVGAAQRTIARHEIDLDRKAIGNNLEI